MNLKKEQLEELVRNFAGRAKEQGLQMPVGGPLGNNTVDFYKERLTVWVLQVTQQNFNLINEAIKEI